ncbi:MAG: type II toxin-antitoxin system Phd/YefM family antitoxin [Ardenticatenaceae bacterium]|nr:type II toxin-antitoxin system Phd/YefM family antitoxin [Ardenticatenaceae bacterium]
MTETTYSIAEARNQFAAIVRDAEETNRPVQVTRRGQPVAVILSAEEYGRLLKQREKRDFWQAYLDWREEWQVDEWDDTDDPFADVRDKSPGREIDLWTE